jgi:hypothetical protein
MAKYVDAGTQTRWAGLMQKEPVRPETLFSSRPDTSTPPDEMMVTEKVQYNDIHPVIATPELSPAQLHPRQPEAPTSPLLARRQNRPQFVAHIDLPSPVLAALDDEVPISPPTTAFVLSPVPEANKRHAGHTPLIPRSPSPQMSRKQPPIELIVDNDEAQLADDEAEQLLRDQGRLLTDDGDQSVTPQQDIGLTGPLTLAPNPRDGAADHIALDALDQELSKIAQLQSVYQFDGHGEPGLSGIAQQEPSQQPASNPAEMFKPRSSENSALSSRKGSADSRRSEDATPVDGVMLKKAPLNFGTPFGEI